MATDIVTDIATDLETTPGESRAGYYRSPTCSGGMVVFVSEDDLWSVPLSGGLARRLTSGLGRSDNPHFSPDGRLLAFTSTEEGNSEIYVMPAEGGRPERLTYLGHRARVLGWSPSGEILMASSHRQPFPQIFEIFAIDPSTRRCRALPTGPGTALSFAPDGRGMVLARHGVRGELAYWKRYRGGTAGEIWIDRNGTGDWRRFIELRANTARPFWIGDRIYFLSDHEEVGNVYSAALDGSDLRKHTESEDFFVRGLNTDGTNLVYHAGGDLHVLNTVEGTGPRKIAIDYRSPKTQLNRKFVSAFDHLEDYEMSPKGERIVIAARGKTFSCGYWKGPVFRHGMQGTFRHRLGRFLNDGSRIVLVSDAGGEEALEIHEARDQGVSRRLDGLDLGRVLDMKLSPVTDEAILTNHRNQIVWVDLGSGDLKVLDRSEFSRVEGFNWSHDGRFVAYGRSLSERTCAIHVCEIDSGRVHRVTNPVLRDVEPFFDPRGEFLYFLSYREFDPVYDNLHFDLGFPRGCRPYLLTLRKDVASPFSSDHPGRGKSGDTNARAAGSSPALQIDFDGIEERIVPFPVPDGRYRRIAANDTRVFFTRLPIDGSLRNHSRSGAPSSKALLDAYDFIEERGETLVSDIMSFRLSQDGKDILYRAAGGLRLIRAGEKISGGGRREETGKKSGWLDLDRVQIEVRPEVEWRQMYREAWRLQRDHFWTEDMSRVDWEQAYRRYLPLLERIATRSELSDLLWEMQGELGTSHAYEIGGDYRIEPRYSIGFLGVETEWDNPAKAWRVTRISHGDPWDLEASSPLARAGVGVREGDWLLAIDGRPLAEDWPPERSLVRKAGQEVSVSFRCARDGQTRARSVRALTTDTWARYRDWVDANRRFVHTKGAGRVGYLHIPDMGPWGYAEFHRYFLVECERAGLIIDVRYNGGGHVSQLLLEKLARRRLGYSQSRWFGAQPYPEESAAGPMVCLTNEYAGSDGDIFSHSFKLLGLGPLIGKRTWGGVIGISPSHTLTDGSVTTQPEYSFWFADVGWKVENYGTEPDLEVEYAPSDYIKGRDPQLERGLTEVKRILRRSPLKRPREFGHLSP